ncbi:YncE family protein [Gelatiniphilus marinus]
MHRKPAYNIQTNGQLYIVNKVSSSITVFDLFTGTELTEIPLSIVPYKLTALKNQNKVVITNYGPNNTIGKNLSIINTKTNNLEKNIEFTTNTSPHGNSTLPKHNKVVNITNSENNLLALDAVRRLLKNKTPSQELASYLLVLHPNKPLAYVTNSRSNSISVINIEKDQVIKTITCGIGTEGIDITPDGLEVWVTNNIENSIHVINTETHQITNTMPTGKESLRLKFSIDGKHCLVTNTGDGTISVYNRYSKKQIKTIHIRGKKGYMERFLYPTPRPVDVLMHPNGQFAFISNSNADKVEVLDMQSLKLVSSIGTARVPDGLELVE